MPIDEKDAQIIIDGINADEELINLKRQTSQVVNILRQIEQFIERLLNKDILNIDDINFIKNSRALLKSFNSDVDPFIDQMLSVSNKKEFLENLKTEKPDLLYIAFKALAIKENILG